MSAQHEPEEFLAVPLLAWRHPMVNRTMFHVSPMSRVSNGFSSNFGHAAREPNGAFQIRSEWQPLRPDELADAEWKYQIR